MPPTTDVKDLEIKAVGIGDPPMIVGIYFNCPAEYSRVELIRAWVDVLREDRKAAGLKARDIFLVASLEPCGGQATYRTIEEVPLVDVPCPCGDPNHWLIKWSEEK